MPEDDVTFIVIRTSDAKLKEFTLSLSTTLNEFREFLTESDLYDGISNVKSSRQRLFYLGRELKSGGRTLARLGLGCNPLNRVVHLHITLSADASENADFTSQSQDCNATGKRKAKPDPPASVQADENDVVELLDDSDGDEELARVKRRRMP